MFRSERVLIALMIAGSVAAQVKAPPTEKKFEVVSVKPDLTGDNGPQCGFSTATFSSPVQFRLAHCPLATLINYAYGRLAGGRINGVPNWAESASYSVSAESNAPASLLEKYAMLQAVIEERFKMKWHWETRQLPVYYLLADGALKLPKTAPGSCQAWDPNGDPPVHDPNQPPLGHVWKNRILPGGGLTLEASGSTLPDLAGEIGRLLGRQGLDATGSKDLVDIHLEFANPQLGNTDASAGVTGTESSAPQGPSGGKKAPTTASGVSPLPSIFTALKNVGLTVKPGRGSLEVFVVDSIQRPSEN